MRRMTSIGLLVVSVLAMSATTASAAPIPKLTLSQAGVALAPGDTFEVFGQNNVEVFTSIGNIECVESSLRNGLLLRDLTNSKWVDELEVVETTAFGGGECRGPEGIGEAEVNLRWGAIVKLRANGKAGTGPVSLQLVFERVPYECTFTAGQLTGSNNATSSPESLTLEYDHKLTLNKSASYPKGCPKSAELFMFFTSNEGEEGIIDEQI
jgi:hypothetical protein